MGRAALWELSTEAAGIGIFVLYLPSRELVVDDRVLELSGLDGESFTGRPEDVYARIHPDDVEEVIAKVERAVTTAGAYSTEYRFLQPDGATRWTAARGQTVTDEAGAVTALVGALYDVTRLREATERVSEVLESMPVGYLAIDGNWRVTDLNAEGERITGASQQDLVGKDFWEAFPSTVGTVFEQHYRHTAATGEITTLDAYYPDPLDVWVEVRAVPEDEGLGLYFLDITARRAAQQAAQRSDRGRVALGEVALALAGARDIGDLVTIVAERGLAAMGCASGAVAIPDPEEPTYCCPTSRPATYRAPKATTGACPWTPPCPCARPTPAASACSSPIWRRAWPTPRSWNRSSPRPAAPSTPRCRCGPAGRSSAC